jgi:hypothetical protein
MLPLPMLMLPMLMLPKSQLMSRSAHGMATLRSTSSCDDQLTVTFFPF